MANPTFRTSATIVVMLREVYGQTAYYPVCDAAHTFASIAGTKTLTMDALKKIRQLGVTIQLTHMEPKPMPDLFTS